MELGPLNAAAGASDFGPAIVDLHQLGEAGRVIRYSAWNWLKVYLAMANPYLRLRDSLPDGLLAVKG
jgi:hypothetical protein